MALSLPGACDRAALDGRPRCDDVRLDDARRVDRGALRYGACGDDVCLRDRWSVDSRALCDSACRGDMRLRQARARCRGALLDRISGDGVRCATTTRTHVEVDSTAGWLE